MRLRFYYWGLVIVWHSLLLVAAYFLLHETYYWFMLAQLGVLLSLVFAYRVYRHFRRPLDLINGGKSALQDRDFSVKYRLTGAREVDALVATYNNMIDTLREERTLLQEQHYFLRKLIEASPSGILIMDHDGNITESNPAARQIIGFDPSSSDEKHPLLSAAFNLTMGDSLPIIIDGTSHYRLEASAFIDRGFQRKFVQIQTLTGEILAAEKRAYGKVIRMMAHEVNNSIGAINALLDTLTVSEEEIDEQWVEDVRESLPIASKRNHQLNVFMRNFADVVRLPDPQRERVDLSKMLPQIATLFQAQAQQQNTSFRLGYLAGRALELPLLKPEKGSGESEVIPVSQFISADSNQLEQVLVNVVKNALESVGLDGEVQLILTERPRQIIIADNGPGLSEEAAAGIFTPFFTSKPNGQGIGLTLVREILTNHDYQFSLATDEDGWTRFIITL
ncbi:sensor histidine kinase [Lewinella cohaerens]|uniref:sensor histidine kinase n=1 Tax=Lewinella cohaerens TaxID=70995 RepID=UPI00037B8A93|nr:ATP-binding protein [Lewinella cohaerens]